jgi:hypothetical protein
MREMMRKWLWLLISVAGLAHAGPSTRIEVAYEMSHDGSVLADVVEVLETGDGWYQITETSKGRGVYALLGSLKRTSRGQLDARGVRPLQYTDERPGWRESRALFDWDARTIKMNHKREERSVTMPPDVQDQLSFILSFARFPPKGSSFAVNVADSRGVSKHLYRVAGRERVRVPAGEFQTVKLVRIKDRGSAEVWLASELGNFPVRAVVVDKDGKRLDQAAVRVTSTSAP